MDVRLIKISFKDIGSIIVELREDWNPKTIDKIIKNLPRRSRANRWGDEVYFSIGIRVEEENSRVDMEVGEVAYWPPGEALCIFFGPTPVSITNKPRAYSPVNPIGVVKEGMEILSRIKGGEEVIVKLVERVD
ncbi:MAG: cyclophilin-like fold protein [archaeon GB-1867-035]|nr:cyclophilin-like fold protein [Candidatus Culexmicrobium profundum]